MVMLMGSPAYLCVVQMNLPLCLVTPPPQIDPNAVVPRAQAEQEEMQKLEEAARGGPVPDYIPRAWVGKLGYFKGVVRNHLGIIVLSPLAGLNTMQKLHEGPGCHAGEKRLLALFRERFWAPQARALANQVVKQCAACQLGKDYGPRPPVQGSTGAVRPWQIWL